MRRSLNPSWAAFVLDLGTLQATWARATGEAPPGAPPEEPSTEGPAGAVFNAVAEEVAATIGDAAVASASTADAVESLAQEQRWRKTLLVLQVSLCPSWRPVLANALAQHVASPLPPQHLSLLLSNAFIAW